MQRKYTPHTTQGAAKATADLYDGEGSGQDGRDARGTAPERQRWVTLAPTEPRFVSVCLAR